MNPTQLVQLVVALAIALPVVSVIGGWIFFQAARYSRNARRWEYFVEGNS